MQARGASYTSCHWWKRSLYSCRWCLRSVSPLPNAPLKLTTKIVPSIFRASLSHLVRISCSIREFSTGERTLLDEGQGANCPRELMRLIDWLMSNAISQVQRLLGLYMNSSNSSREQSGLFVENGDSTLVDRIREVRDLDRLNCAQHLTSNTWHSVWILVTASRQLKNNRIAHWHSRFAKHFFSSSWV